MQRDPELAADQNPARYPYRSWTGAMREYDAADKRWHVFGPLWHTGQAVKALVQAYRVLGEAWVLEAATTAADFIMAARHQDASDPYRGLITAFENHAPEASATSCMLEALDGLFYMTDETGVPDYTDAAVAALDWARRNVFLPECGLFLDDFVLARGQARSAPNTLLHGVPGRPLADDGVFLKGYHRTGDIRLRDVFFGTAERLLAEEDPPGNWINFPPCDSVGGIIHPRHAFWWGRPMIAAWKESNDDRYLQCALRTADWYVGAQRLDGGMFRGTTRDFRTTSHGQATSGILAAACLWLELMECGRGEAYRAPVERTLHYARRAQFENPSDPDLNGAVLEKTRDPDGSDRPPFLVRDLGTIFYAMALSAALRSGVIGRLPGGETVNRAQ